MNEIPSFRPCRHFKPFDHYQVDPNGESYTRTDSDFCQWCGYSKFFHNDDFREPPFWRRLHDWLWN